MRATPPAGILFVVSSVASGCLVGDKPSQGDSDGDFIQDEVELEGWDLELYTAGPPCDDLSAIPDPVTVHVTSNPHARDTDGDGLDDTDEFNWKGHPQSPDGDGDGLPDADEKRMSESREVVQILGSLKLNRVDSDFDCLWDGEEVNGTDIPGIGFRTTDPGTKDTDHDGLLDAVEVRERHTDPRNNNTDGDDADDMLDLDPLRNLGLDLVFDRFTVKSGSGAVPIRFNYSIETPAGARSAPESVGAFSAAPGQAMSVPADQSPGTLDTRDASPTGSIYLQFWVTRTDTGQVLNLTPASPARIVQLLVAPNESVFSPDGVAAAADGSVSTIETNDAKLEFRLRLVVIG